MNKEELILSLQKELQQASWDIKAEALLVAAFKYGFSIDDFLLCCDHTFKREFSKDLVTAEFVADPKKNPLLELHLSRTGLYDQLPEGLFFQAAGSVSRNLSVNDMVADYKHNKKKEEEIRRFFIPFDNDFFIQRLQLEQQETFLLEGLRTGILNDYFVQFWGLPNSIPKMFMAPLILLLPFANKIAGDLGLTGECLGYLLKEEVRVNGKKSQISRTTYPMSIGLGNCIIGLDMVCGDEFFDDNLSIEIEIGPLKYSQVKDYLEGGRRWELLETFNRYFLPAGVDTIFTIKTSQESEDMLLEKGAEPILGYSSVLC